MLYTYGDSFTYGWNLQNLNKNWGTVLSKKLKVGYRNYAYPGGSNWRICRELYNTRLRPNDIVIIGWTISNRFEFGKLDRTRFYNGQNKWANPKNDIQPFHQEIANRIFDPRISEFARTAYEVLSDDDWFDDMFNMLYWSVRSYLDRSKVKWFMFDTWTSNILDGMEHDNYVYSGRKNMNDYLKKRDNYHLEKGYWNESGHQKVADIFYELYWNQCSKS